MASEMKQSGETAVLVTGGLSNATRSQIRRSALPLQAADPPGPSGDQAYTVSPALGRDRQVQRIAGAYAGVVFVRRAGCGAEVLPFDRQDHRSVDAEFRKQQERHGALVGIDLPGSEL